LFYYLSPYLIVDATINRVVSGSFILFVAQFGSALFLGRLFCGWVCPAGGIQDALIVANPKRVTRGNLIKWGIWLAWLAAIIAIAVAKGGYERIDPLYKTDHGFSVSSLASLITYLLVLVIIVVPSLIVGRRSFCHHVCWMAPFMIVGQKIGVALRLPRLRLSADPGKCVACHQCTNACPMSLDVESLVATGSIESGECVKCLACVDTCAKGAIRLGR
jgi:polyferredoxin